MPQGGPGRTQGVSGACEAALCGRSPGAVPQRGPRGSQGLLGETWARGWIPRTPHSYPQVRGVWYYDCYYYDYDFDYDYDYNYDYDYDYEYDYCYYYC